jgi:hypothetical protein
MSPYLTAAAIGVRAEELRMELDRLLSRPGVARRPKSKQWAFLRHCFEVIPRGAGAAFPCTEAQAAQLKFEVSERLTEHYLLASGSTRVVFRLMALEQATKAGLVAADYPSANGYALLISERLDELPASSGPQTRLELKSAITAAIEAEWAVYCKLPQIDLTPLVAVFLPDGPAHQQIERVCKHHGNRRWTLRVPSNNPSTKRLLDFKVARISNDEASVRTSEYWYLRWWSLEKDGYIRIDMRETHGQRYALVKRGARWLVVSTFYPPQSAGTRRRKR